MHCVAKMFLARVPQKRSTGRPVSNQRTGRAFIENNLQKVLLHCYNVVFRSGTQHFATQGSVRWRGMGLHFGVWTLTSRLVFSGAYRLIRGPDTP